MTTSFHYCFAGSDQTAVHEERTDRATVGRGEMSESTPGENEGSGPDTGGERHETVPGAPADPGDRSFGWRGWALVGALVVSLLVIPWTIIYLRQAQSFLASLGLGLRDAYLVLPLIPAFGLGALAVWSAVASRRDHEGQR
mgnify:CR=1 FL=1